MLKRIIKLAVSLCVYSWDRISDRLVQLTGHSSRARAVVLYYHGISDQEKAPFARQMNFLTRAVQPIPAAPQRLTPGGRYAAVTFDDGFVSVLKNALPVLRERQIPATIFVPSGYLGAAPGWLRKESLKARQEVIVTPDQLTELAADPLITIGSHTVSHPRLTTLDRETAFRELSDSKASLEEIIRKEVALFSFPHGAFNSQLLDHARAVGYRIVFGIKPALAFESPDEFLTGRVPVDPADWSIEFRLKLRGAYRWLS